MGAVSQQLVTPADPSLPWPAFVDVATREGEQHSESLPWPALIDVATREGEQHFESVADPTRLRERICEILEASDDPAFAEFRATRELGVQAYEKLIARLVPAMGAAERQSLFVSLDASNDGFVQERELLSPVTLAILRNRLGHGAEVEVHPLRGSYFCLPNPPFRQDPMQLDVLERGLLPTFKAVVEGGQGPSKPSTSAPRSAAPKVQAPRGGGFFGSLFSGVQSRPAGGKNGLAKPKPVPVSVAPRGVYMHGGTGCGKTVLLDIFFRSLPAHVPARRLHWHEFIRDAMRSMQKHGGSEKVYEAMAASCAAQFKVLLLDELLVTHVSEALLVKSLFRQLWAHGVTLVITSNYAPTALYSDGFNREQFLDFLPELAQECAVFDMTGDVDFRREGSGLAGEAAGPCFVHPLGAESMRVLEERFRAMMPRNGEDFQDQVELEVPDEKRSVTALRAGECKDSGTKVGWFSFKDLCKQSRGRADYIAIASQMNTVFLEGVPEFDANLGAEFHRFVSLTDMLYGKKVRLFLQSEVPVEQIFERAMQDPDALTDDLWRYKRCTSMLCEMQSPKYQHMVWLMRNHLLREEASRL